MSAERRARLWRNAAAIAAAEGDARRLPARARRRLRRDSAPIALADIAAAPDWIHWSAERRTRLARLTGVILIARRLQRTLDGATLRAAVDAVGERALEIVLRLPAAVLPPTAPDFALEPARLEAAGAAVLLLADVKSRALAERLAPLLPPPSGCGLSRDPAREVIETARNVLFELEAGE